MLLVLNLIKLRDQFVTNKDIFLLLLKVLSLAKCMHAFEEVIDIEMI